MRAVFVIRLVPPLELRWLVQNFASCTREMSYVPLARLRKYMLHISEG
jgi:hypothetical protein